jgi:hypothetical protein
VIHLRCLAILVLLKESLSAGPDLLGTFLSYITLSDSFYPHIRLVHTSPTLSCYRMGDYLSCESLSKSPKNTNGGILVAQ